MLLCVRGDSTCGCKLLFIDNYSIDESLTEIAYRFKIRKLHQNTYRSMKRIVHFMNLADEQVIQFLLQIDENFYPRLMFFNIKNNLL